MSHAPHTARRKLIGGLAGLATACALFATPAIPVTTANAVPGPLINYVNNFIGTLNNGNTYPGATTPFGMVQFSPDNAGNTGYAYNNTALRGFSLMHVSGAGCGIGSFMPILPRVGTPTSTNWTSTAYTQTLTEPRHDPVNEEAHPGYFRVRSGGGASVVETELTATTRTGVARYTFPAASDATVLINAGYSNSSNMHESSATIVDDRTVVSSSTLSGFCAGGVQLFTVYTKTVFDRAFDLGSSTTWSGTTVPGTPVASSTATRAGAMLKFDTTTDQTVVSQTSLSYVDATGAGLNLAAENVNGDFDSARVAAEALWETQLGTIQIESTNLTKTRSFYSALYRTFVAPNISEDVDGRFVGFGAGYGTIHNIADADVGLTHYYQNFSLWDTYRTQESFLALVAPAAAKDQVKSLVLHGEYNGWAPRWTYGPIETNIMTGDPITVFLTAAYEQGLLAGAWAERAYNLLWQNVNGIPPDDNPSDGRQGNTEYLPYGFVPWWDGADHKGGDYDYDHGPSATLEYALADAMLARMATSLGHTADAQILAERGQNYKSMWDPDTGSFRTRSHDNLGWELSPPTDAFHEGVWQQYQWLVEQDVPGIMALMGGRDAMIERLDTFFDYENVLANPQGTATCGWVGNCSAGGGGSMTYYGVTQYNPNNEPDINSPFMYNWVNQPWKTADITSAAQYLYTDTPDGMTGNDDLGTMSGWQVLTSIGLFPMAPGADIWGITTPEFDKVVIKLDRSFYTESSGQLTINAPGRETVGHYVQSMQLNGVAYGKSYVTSPQIVIGAGNIDFVVGANPSTWATAADSNPGSLVPFTGAYTKTTGFVSRVNTRIVAGTEATVEADVLLRGDSSQTLAGTFSLPDGSPLKIDKTSWSGSPGAGGVLTDLNVPINIRVPLGTAPGTYIVQGTAPSQTGQQTAISVTVADPPINPWWASSATVKSTGSPGSGAANVDGSGHYVLTTAMENANLGRGRTLTIGSGANQTRYVLPVASDTENDSFSMDGSTIDVEKGLVGATRLQVVALSTLASAQPLSMTLGFTDGGATTTTSTSNSIRVWTGTSGTSRAGSTMTQRGNGTAVETANVSLYYTAVYTVPAGRSIKTITWPTNPNLRVLAIASNGTPAQPQWTNPTAEIGGSVGIGDAVLAPTADWDITGVTTTYQWYRDGIEIPGETGSSHTIASADTEHDLAVVLKGQADGYDPVFVTSDALAVPLDTITATVASRVTGNVRVGATVTGVRGNYDAAGSTSTYRWLANGSPIPDATATTLPLTVAYLGNQLVLEVTTSAEGYEDLVETITAGTVAKGTITRSGTPAIGSATTARVGDTKTVSSGTYTPSTAVVSYQWKADGVDIAGATSTSLLITPDLLGAALTVTLTARADGYNDLVFTTNASSAVTATNTTTVLAPPLLTGTAQVGQTLSVAPGAYTGSGWTFEYTWYREGALIAGATQDTYTLTADDADAAIFVQVRRVSPYYAASTAVTPSVIVAPADLRVLVQPSLDGAAIMDGLLSVSEGQYGAVDANVAIQWLRDGQPIVGATGITRRLTAADVGHAISVEVAASKPGYATVVSYAGPLSIAAAPLSATASPQLTATAGAAVGATLSVSQGAYTSGGTRVAYQWTADGVPIAGAVAASFTVTEAQAGRAVACVVTVSKPGYATVVTRTPSIPVPAAPAGSDQPSGTDPDAGLPTPSPQVKPESTITVGAGSAVYGAAVQVSVTLGQGTGAVVFYEGATVLGSAVLVGGVAKANLAGLSVGSHTITAKYAGDGTTQPSVQEIQVTVAKAAAAKVTVTGKAFKKNTRPKVTVTVGALTSGKPATGRVRVYVGNKAVKSVSLSAAKQGKVSVTLPKKYAKTISVKAKYLPSSRATTVSTTSKAVKVKVKK